MSKARTRRPEVRPTVGLIVEGDTEFLALPLLHRKALVPGCPPLRAINLGGVGSHMQPIGIAKMIVPKIIQHLAAGRNLVVVCLDREQRVMPAARLAEEVLQNARALLKPQQRSSVSVVVADRTFEAWILADARGLHRKRLFQRAPGFHAFEGQMGRENKKGLVELAELLGRPYVKTTDGPRLFEQLGFSNARKHGPNAHGSESLDNFLRALAI